MKTERHRENACDHEKRNWTEAAANHRMPETAGELPEQAEDGSCTGLRGSLALLRPGLRDNKFMLFQTTQFVVLCYSSPKKLV